MQETQFQSLGWEDPLEKGMVATHSSMLAWRIPWTERSLVGYAVARTPSLYQEEKDDEITRNFYQ